MNVLMYGWTYPPKLGRVEDLSSIARDLQETKITFVATNQCQTDHAQLLSITAKDHNEYAKQASIVANNISPDIIHAYDWHTFQAAVEKHQETGKPLIIQLNETTFDRHQGMKDAGEFAIESAAIALADKVVAGNARVKDRLLASYKVDASKVEEPKEILNIYKHAKNSYVLQGNARDEEGEEEYGGDEHDEDTEDDVYENVQAAHMNTHQWMQWGVMDFLIGIGIGFIISLLVLAIG